MSDSEDADMDPTPRRRRNSKETDPPNMSGDSSREQDDEETERREEQERLKREEEERLKKEEEERLKREEEEERLKRKEEEERLRREEEERLKRKEEEERLKREEEERLSALVLKEEMKIQEFVQQSPDQLKEIDEAVRELKKIADDVHNDRDAVVVVAPAFLLIRRGVLLAAAGALIAVVGAVLFLFTEGGGTVFGTGAVLFTLSAGIAGIAALALRAYNKNIEDIRENARRRIAELGRSATTAIVAVLTLKRLSGLRTAADPDDEKVFETQETDSRLRDLIRRMEDTSGAEKLADSPIDQMAETIFPNNLEEFYSWFGIIVSFNIREQKNKKARKIEACAVKLEENLEAVREIHAAVTTRLN